MTKTSSQLLAKPNNDTCTNLRLSAINTFPSVKTDVNRVNPSLARSWVPVLVNSY